MPASTEYKIGKLGGRMDSEAVLAEIQQIRVDRAAPKCGSGTKLCGNSCVPQAHVCKNQGSSAGKAVADALGGAALGLGIFGASKLRLKTKPGLSGTPKPTISAGKIGNNVSTNIDSLIGRLDSFLQERTDAPKCEPGNKPCGKRCIPEKHSCSAETAKGVLKGGLVGGFVGGPVGSVGGAVYGGLRARGHGKGKSAAIGTAAALGTVAAVAGLPIASHVIKKKMEEDKDEKDAYTTLGVKKGASKDEIKNAYRNASKKYHPDVNKSADAGAQFRKVNEAYNRIKKDSFSTLREIRSAEINRAYSSIQQDFPGVSSSFWYSF